MGATKEWYLTMRDADYCSLPVEYRLKFTSEKVIYPDEHRKFWDEDERYRALYTEYSKAKKELEKYKFEKRNAINPGHTS